MSDRLAGRTPGDSTPWVHDDADGGAPLVETPAAACTIQTHHDEYYGFSVGHPEGWLIDYSTGSIVIAKDRYAFVGAMIFPVRIKRKGVTADQVATMFARGLGKKIVQRGGTFEMSDKHTDGKIARAMIKANVSGVALKGPLEVVQKPGFVTLKLYWAPEEVFDADEATLKQVVGCFKRDTLVTAKKPVAPAGGPVTKVGVAPDPLAASGPPPQALTPHLGRYVHMSMPAGWKITDEGDHGIDVIAGDGKISGGFAFVLNPIGNAATYVRQSIHASFPGAHIVHASFVPAPRGWQVYEAEFDGTTKGNPIHGFQRVAMSRGILLTWNFQMVPDQWAPMKSTVVAMLATAQIQPAAIAQVQAKVRAQLASYPKVAPSPTPSTSSSSAPMGSWQEGNGDEPRDKVDDFIRSQDRAVSPTTGEQYVCPYNMWQSDGPQGAGYYRPLPSGGSELLNTQE